MDTRHPTESQFDESDQNQKKMKTDKQVKFTRKNI